ncbi:ATP-binding cassette domain-containing protein [Paenibacillus gorillae]|uniref:ATP-binding cassette domain-containing protein n=1 Tax=Paenibacillus gorillae TaxID=1243662 RepID=UPI0004B9A1FB|nr:ATP-binding cassette domain-containing protein [Paenibacillus gorillae]
MLDIRNASFSYTDEDEEDTQHTSRVLHQVTASIEANEFVALLGRNGSGKSSFTRLLNGIEIPSEGTVQVEGKFTHHSPSLPLIRRAVQIVFQNPENQQVGMTVGEDIAFGLSNIGYPQQQMQERIAWAIDLVGLDADVDRPVTRLSGGEKQKLALAAVLALSPKYLILDEATSMLDPLARKQFVATLHEARKRHPFALIYITHHLEEVLEADRWVLFRNGRIHLDGPPAQFLNDEALLAECGLELPYYHALALALQAKGISVPASLGIEELRDLLCRFN